MRILACGLVCGLLLATMPAFAVTAKTCDVRAFGAKGNGFTKDTAAIQKAIDSCSVVVLNGGTFVSGPISLHSGTTLQIDKGTTLLGSPDRSDYPMVTFARKETVQPLVSAVNAHDVTIDGGGTIDGNGHVWWAYVKGVKDSGVLGTDHPRPMGVVFDHTNHVRMENVTVQDSGFWQIVPYYANDVVIRNVKVFAPKSPNTDAIDPFSSSHVTIDHVFSSVGDDNIAIKSGAINSPGPDAPSQYITIEDCTFANGHGLSIGSEISGGAQHILAERIHFLGTDNGIRIKANRDRGHDVSDITFKDIDMKGVKTAILISEYYPKAYPAGVVTAAPVTRLTPHFHDITIENVTSTDGGSDGVIVGLPESPVVGLTLKNVHLSGKTGMRIAYAKVKFEGVSMNATQGPGLTVAPSATVTGK